MDKSDLEVYQNIYMTDTTGVASFNPNRANSRAQVCQICGVVLKIDTNISNMTESTYRRMSNPFANCRDMDLDMAPLSGHLDPDMEISMSAIDSELSRLTSEDPLYHKSVSVISNPRSFYFCPASINITESTTNNPSSNNDLMTGWSARINATSALFDMMSANTNIDHPLCEECADQLVNQLDAQCKVNL